MGKVVTKALLSNDEDRVLIKNGQLTESTYGNWSVS